MRIAWLTYLDPFVFSGGGELHQRTLIEVARSRGHTVNVSAWLRQRPQRAARRLRVHRGLSVDWDADLFVLANINNCPQRSDRIPPHVVERALSTGRAALLADAWVDVCALDMPCGGDPAQCPPQCDRRWANAAFATARHAIFVSPMQRRMIENVLDVDLPAVVLSRPQIDTHLFRPLALERDIDVLYVGTIERKKGYDNLLARFGADRLTFVGANHLGEPVAGTYLGPLPHGDLPPIYNRARTFAHLPQWHEPMGRTVVEAGLCGCELVVNDRVGVRSYPPEDWTDPQVVQSNSSRFWREMEAAIDVPSQRSP